MQDRLLKFVKEDLLNHRSGSDVTLEADLLGSGLVDSVGMMRLVAYIEEARGRKIPVQDLVLENFQTIQAITTYLDSHPAA